MGKNACGMGINMILDVIVEDKKKRLVEHKAAVSEEEMKQKALQSTRKSVGFAKALKKDGLSVIGEFKKASPSHGAMDIKVDLKERILQYNDSVDAISCLTEEDHFHGNVGYLKEIRGKSELPILRKDFMIDEYQFYEAKTIGADAVLLIAAILDDAQMKGFYKLARSLGLDALVEVHDEEEMERALKLDARIIGVNNRNLRDFTISLDNTKRLRGMAGADKIFVAESGIITDDDVLTLKEYQVDAFLIGRAFMEADNPKELAKHWKAL